MLPERSVGLKAVSVIAKERRVRIRRRQVGIGCNCASIVKETGSISVDRTVADGAAESSKIDNFVSALDVVGGRGGVLCARSRCYWETCQKNRCNQMCQVLGSYVNSERAC